MSETGHQEAQLPTGPSQEAKTWAMVIHLSLLLGYLVPIGGLVAPIVIYLVKKETLPEIVPHAHVVFNWLISLLIYGIVGLILILAFGLGILVLMALGLLSLVFPIIGAVKASEGDLWAYPLSIPVFK